MFTPRYWVCSLNLENIAILNVAHPVTPSEKNAIHFKSGVKCFQTEGGRNLE